MSPVDDSARSGRLTVVIPARDAAGTIRHQLTAIEAQSVAAPGLEVIVVDDGSLDDTRDVVGEFEGVTVLEGPRRGPAAARNAGARVASTSLLCFVDADDVVGDGWAAAMVASLQEHEVVTGPLDLASLNEPAWSGARGSSWGNALDRFEGAFPYASSCNLGIRRSVFDAIGGFDETLVVGEDLELSLRLSLAGHSIHFDDHAVVHYRTRATMRTLALQAFRYGRAAAEVAARSRRAGLRTNSGLYRRGLWLVRNLGLLAAPDGRARWVWLASNALGRALGPPRGSPGYDPSSS